MGEYRMDGLMNEDLRNIVLTDLVSSHVALAPHTDFLLTEKIRPGCKKAFQIADGSN